MARAKSMDIDDMPALIELADTLAADATPRTLRRNGKVVATISPARRRGRRRVGEQSAADFDAFVSAAGGWKDVDTEKLVDDIYAARRSSDRAPIEL